MDLRWNLDEFFKTNADFYKKIESVKKELTNEMRNSSKSKKI